MADYTSIKNMVIVEQDRVTFVTWGGVYTRKRDGTYKERRIKEEMFGVEIGKQQDQAFRRTEEALARGHNYEVRFQFNLPLSIQGFSEIGIGFSEPDRKLRDDKYPPLPFEPRSSP